MVMRSVLNRMRGDSLMPGNGNHNNTNKHGNSNSAHSLLQEVKNELREKGDKLHQEVPHGLQQDPEDHPNYGTYKRMERIVQKLQDERYGVPIKTVKSFMSKIPSVFTGIDLITWMTRHLDIDDQSLSLEALHLAHLIAAHGYIFPIDDHVLTVKNDTNAYYRFQTPFLWPSNWRDPEEIEYAIYLCKRTMQNKQRLELADYEAENLAKLQKALAKKWEFICMHAEAQAKTDKKRDKIERKILDSQERAFWDVHRPAPGCICTTEIDMRKACKMAKPTKAVKRNYFVPGGRISPSVSQVDLVYDPNLFHSDEIDSLQKNIARRRLRVSKVAECMISNCEQYLEYDSFVTTPEPSNPWISDSVEFWEQDLNIKEIPTRRVRRWAFSVKELVGDPAGREQFRKFLEKEFSSENLLFWEACQYLRSVPSSDVQEKVQEIYDEFLAPGATMPINIDCRVAEKTRDEIALRPRDRYCFEEAADQIFNLMNRDSYNRYLRSDAYKEILGGLKKKVSKRWFGKLPASGTLSEPGS